MYTNVSYCCPFFPGLVEWIIIRNHLVNGAAPWLCEDITDAEWGQFRIRTDKWVRLFYKRECWQIAEKEGIFQNAAQTFMKICESFWLSCHHISCEHGWQWESRSFSDTKKQGKKNKEEEKCIPHAAFKTGMNLMFYVVYKLSKSERLLWIFSTYVKAGMALCMRLNPTDVDFCSGLLAVIFDIPHSHIQI